MESQINNTNITNNQPINIYVTEAEDPDEDILADMIIADFENNGYMFYYDDLKLADNN